MPVKPKVTLISHTLAPEQTSVAAIRQCYSSKGGNELKAKTDAQTRKRLINQVVSFGHLSTIEHASFTFAIEGVSRALTHQLVRHRIASFSQQSQRYVKFKGGKFEYVLPPTIQGKPALKKKFEDFIKKTSALYNELTKSGIPAEDARYMLPNAVETKLIVTMNARELLHFFEKRLCTRAQWEIRILAQQMLKAVKDKAPEIFKCAGPSCETLKICFEGDLNCGKWKGIKGAILKTR